MIEWTEVGKKKYLITQPAIPIELDTIKVASAKKYIAAAQDGGFMVNASVSIASEKGDVFKSGARAGQERDEKSIAHLWVSASALVGTRTVAAFLLHFMDGRWSEAKVWDSAGWPTEARADYSINVLEAKRLGLTEGEARERGDRLDAQYNTGETYINHQARWLQPRWNLRSGLATSCRRSPRRPDQSRKQNPRATTASNSYKKESGKRERKHIGATGR